MAHMVHPTCNFQRLRIETSSFNFHSLPRSPRNNQAFFTWECDFTGVNWVVKKKGPWLFRACMDVYMGVSLNGGTPKQLKHPKMIILSRKTNGCWVPSF